MKEKQKLINWIAGMTTVIVALLIVIVALEPKEYGVSRATAARAVALAMMSKDDIISRAPDESKFPVELQGEWYIKYLDCLYSLGYSDTETHPATEDHALSFVTYGELSAWIQEAAGNTEEVPEEYLVEPSSRKAGKTVGKAEFWEYYDAFLKIADRDGNVKVLETDLYGTPNNVDTAAAWTAYTKDGKFMFEGLVMDNYIDRRIRVLVRDQEILKVEEVVSDEIVYENAWISGYEDRKVTVFIGNIQKEFPVKGVL